MNNENNIINFMDIKLSSETLAIDLLKAKKLLKEAKQEFYSSGFKITATKLNNILKEIDNSINTSLNLKEATSKMENAFNKVSLNTNFDDELLKLNLTNDEVQYLEDLVLSEMHFADEID